MTNDTQSQTIAQAHLPHINAIDAKLRRLTRCKRPAKRSRAAAMKRTGMSYEQLQLGNRRRQLIRWEHILKVAVDLGPSSLRELAKRANANWRTCREALKHDISDVLAKLRQAFISFSIQGGNREQKTTLPTFRERIDSFFASLSAPNAANKVFPRASQASVGEIDEAAIDKSDSAKRCPILYSTNEETGEVMQYDLNDKCFVWTPTASCPKPPGSPFGSNKRSEKKSQASAAPIPTPSMPPPPSKPPEIYVPCPPEIKEQMTNMFEQFNMERIIRDARYGKLRHKDGRKLTHLEQLEIADPADEGWHARYGRLAAQIANSHKPEDK